MNPPTSFLPLLAVFLGLTISAGFASPAMDESGKVTFGTGDIVTEWQLSPISTSGGEWRGAFKPPVFQKQDADLIESTSECLVTENESLKIERRITHADGVLRIEDAWTVPTTIQDAFLHVTCPLVGEGLRTAKIKFIESDKDQEEFEIGELIEAGQWPGATVKGFVLEGFDGRDFAVQFAEPTQVEIRVFKEGGENAHPHITMRIFYSSDVIESGKADWTFRVSDSAKK